VDIETRILRWRDFKQRTLNRGGFIPSGRPLMATPHKTRRGPLVSIGTPNSPRHNDSRPSSFDSVRLDSSTVSMMPHRTRASRLSLRIRGGVRRDRFVLRIVRSIKVEMPKQHVRYAILCKNGKINWTIEKRYSDLHELNRSLRKQFPNCAWADLFPKKTLFTNTMDQAFISERADRLQEYLDACCVDPEVVGSSEFRSFIIDEGAPMGAGETGISPRKDGESASGKMNKGKRKVIMGHIYGMVDEIFELTRHGWMNKQVVWTAKQLLSLFYNSALYRGISSSMMKMTSEENLTGAINGLTDVLWPDGKLYYESPEYEPWVEPTGEELFKRRLQATDLTVLFIDSYVPMLGRDYAVRGAMKFLEFLQVDTLVQHLAFTLLDHVIIQILPQTEGAIKSVHVEMASNIKKRRRELLKKFREVKRD